MTEKEFIWHWKTRFRLKADPNRIDEVQSMLNDALIDATHNVVVDMKELGLTSENAEIENCVSEIDLIND